MCVRGGWLVIWAVWRLVWVGAFLDCGPYSVSIAAIHEALSIWSEVVCMTEICA
jgi:hypothetical protein